MNFFKKEEMEKGKDDSQKSKLYLIVFGAMLLIALILTVSKMFNKPEIENNEVKKVVEKEAPKIEEQNINTESNTEILGNKDDLVNFSVKPGDIITGVINFSGSVKNAYFFEGNILINILDSQKNVILKSYANATTDWMTSEPVEFEGSIDLSKFASKSYYIEIHNDNASGLPENDKSILIPIYIGENSEFLKIQEDCNTATLSGKTDKYMSFKVCLTKNGVPSWP